jgi:hypothetical protein
MRSNVARIVALTSALDSNLNVAQVLGEDPVIPEDAEAIDLLSKDGNVTAPVGKWQQRRHVVETVGLFSTSPKHSTISVGLTGHPFRQPRQKSNIFNAWPFDSPDATYDTTILMIAPR